MTRPTWIAFYCVCLLLPGATRQGRALATPVRVLAYAKWDGGDDPFDEVARLNAAGGIDATGTNSLGDVDATNLAQYDVFYAASEYYDTLDVKAGVLQTFLSDGHGIVVGQANTEGPIDWLPPGLEASVASYLYPVGGHFDLTSSGLSHPIFQGLTTSDFGTEPTDTIYVDSLGPGWDVLMVHSSDPNIVGLAAGSYGHGRILLWPANLDADVSPDPSLPFLRQAFEWVAIPEPTALSLLSLGGLLMAGRRRWSPG